MPEEGASVLVFFPVTPPGTLPDNRGTFARELGLIRPSGKFLFRFLYIRGMSHV